MEWTSFEHSPIYLCVMKLHKALRAYCVFVKGRRTTLLDAEAENSEIATLMV